MAWLFFCYLSFRPSSPFPDQLRRKNSSAHTRNFNNIRQAATLSAGKCGGTQVIFQKFPALDVSTALLPGSRVLQFCNLGQIIPLMCFKTFGSIKIPVCNAVEPGKVPGFLQYRFQKATIKVFSISCNQVKAQCLFTKFSREIIPVPLPGRVVDAGVCRSSNPGASGSRHTRCSAIASPDLYNPWLRRKKARRLSWHVQTGKLPIRKSPGVSLGAAEGRVSCTKSSLLSAKNPS